MKLQRAEYKVHTPSFGQRIEIGDTKGDYMQTNPLAYYMDRFAKSELPKEQKKLSSDEVVKLHQAIKAHIGVLQPMSGPIDPTLKANESSYIVEKQEIGLSAAIDPEVEKANLILEEEVESKFQIASKDLAKKEDEAIDILHSGVMATDKSSPEYIDRIIETNQFMAKGMNMEINTESGILGKIAKSNDATIFLINHYWAPYDSGLGNATIAELYKSYKENDINKFPEPRYILNKSTLENMPPKLRESFKKIETVGVSAPSYPTEWSAKYNRLTMPTLIKGFINDKNHIIIHPEGRRSLYKKDLPLEERFQAGIAKVVQAAVEKKGRVRVVSIGTDYHDGLGVSNIGEPIYFEKDGNQIKVTKGNIVEGTEAAANNSFYKKLSTLNEGESLTICHKGKPLELINEQSSKFMSRLIAGIMCTDMDISAKNATKTLEKFKEVPCRGIIGRTYWRK